MLMEGFDLVNGLKWNGSDYSDLASWEYVGSFTGGVASILQFHEQCINTVTQIVRVFSYKIRMNGVKLNCN